MSSVTNQIAWSHAQVTRRQPAPEPANPSIVIGDDERKDFIKRREALGLSTRTLAAAAKTSNATVTNIEGGTQRTAKRSLYVNLVRVLYGSTVSRAEDLADAAIAKNDAAVKRLARALGGHTAETIEGIAIGLESAMRKSR